MIAASAISETDMTSKAWGWLLLACLPAGAAIAVDGPVFDVHVHLREGDTSVRAYEADVASAGITLEGFAGMWFGGPHQALQGAPARIRDNNEALLALAGREDKLLPVAIVHPYDGQAALDELVRLAGAGVRIIKLHPHTQQFDVDDPRVLALVRRAGELGVIVLFDNANILAGDSERLFNLAVRAPKTRFVLAHIGGLNFRFWNILALARTADDFFMDNLYFDLSATVLLAADSPIEAEFVWTLRNIGIGQILLGSDYPQIPLSKTLEALERLDLTDDEKTAIRIGNARRLFGLDH